MPATYTYNDALEDAKTVIVKAWDATGNPIHMHLVLEMMGRIDALKRSERRKRSKVPQSPAAGQ